MSALNKRQQARNERALQELIKTVSGNNICADCGAKNPGWASWSLGIFLCVRCASLHRKLGTHLSKVKSLSMDKWDNAQVDNMKRIGNVESNKIYNPRNVKPQMPIDIDEIDGAMERFIRSKYEQRIYMLYSRPGTRHNTGASTSSEDRPPPLPPKPTGRFGFGLRKADSSPRDLTPPASPSLEGFGQDISPPRVNKPSRVFGSNIHTSGDGFEPKLATLRDMGFSDNKRNSTVLKGLNGNLDKTVETLIRLGEQNHAKSSGSTPAKPSANGLSFDRTNTASAATPFTNPFDALDAVAPLAQQQSQAAPIQAQQISYGVPSTQPTQQSNSYNPFLSQASQAQYQQQSFPQQQDFNHQQNSQQQNLEQSFQGMQLSNQQPLFPNRTGGHAQYQPSQTNPFHQTSFTPPPMPQIPEQYSSLFSTQPQYQSMSSPTSPGNPFLKSSRSQIFTPTNSNPFGQVSQHQPIPQQQQVSNPWMQQQQTQVSSTYAANPWQSQQSSFSHNSVNQPRNYQQPTFQGNPSPFDKTSILSMYNYPQLAPQSTQQLQAPSAPAQASAPTAPVSGHMNPFASGASQQGQPLSAAQTPGVRHVSNESVDFAGLMGGRHSPDAFGQLSASFRR